MIATPFIFILVYMSYLRSFAIIAIFLMAGKGFQSLTQIPIPGSILGMLLLFTALSTGLLPPNWAKPSCHLLIRHMAILFVPVGVGLMNYLDLLQANALPVLVSTLGSSLVVLLFVGWYVQRKESD
ncbi:CidA/LrgA family protein [Photobacterium sp. GJ3]|uniref:CidA/LrgA family protein n=1 Tax=Photobacterium sp. GJ3 TaxID=2829502 RepID=UPI002012FEAA|nr:CidA/LrgA family protein [Photobacterium sp. GJ3]